MWIVGFISSLVYVLVYSQSKIYGYAALNIYYVAISVYGWYCWRYAPQPDGSVAELHISRIKTSLALRLTAISVVLYIASAYILEKFTDSTVPYFDALGASLSIVATWMLAKKIIEHWILWIFINSFSAALCFSQKLYPTSVLFIVYVIMSVVGWMKWKKNPLIAQKMMVDHLK